MADKKIIAVLGATGAQGGGLVRAIMGDKSGPFTARALTRDVNSAKAQALAALGAELVTANVDDLESLTRAFAGAHGAFCVTFFWDHMSPEKEIAEARIMAQAANLKNVPLSLLLPGITLNTTPCKDIVKMSDGSRLLPSASRFNPIARPISRFKVPLLKPHRPSMPPATQTNTGEMPS